MADDFYSPQLQTQQMPLPSNQQYQQQYQQQNTQQYQPQYQQQYQPQHHMRMPSEDATSTGQWVLNLFLVAIPIVGLVLLFVWAFGSNTAPSKKNWARANLIWVLIAIILCIVLVVVSMALGLPFADYLRQHYNIVY